jgi:hypothetical protein
MSLLPRNDEYHEAVQNPRIAFNDTDLMNCKVENTPQGMPLPYSGGFTVTYKLLNNQKNWAVRCFHRDIQDLQVRYQIIGTFLQKNYSQYFVEAKYLSQGIKINGKPYPIIKMQWLEGEPLNIYLSKSFKQKVRIERLIADFINLVNELERFGIAHGDLQHGNIIVKNDKLYLIDYDGMYFPELSSLKTNEIGHVNYQHPQRSASNYNKNIDRFSEIVIYIGLKAISIKPSLWNKYDNSENILFKSKDFADLQNSELIQDLSAISEIKPLVERLIGCCHLEFDKVPALKDFLSGNFVYDKNAVGTITITRSQYEIIDASKKGSLLEHFGEKIEVIGRISGKHSGSTYHGSPYMFLNFGVYPAQTFTLVIWAEGITALSTKGMSPASLVSKWVSVTGVIGSYLSKPQMIIELASQIQILSGEIEANQRLKVEPQQKNTPTTPPIKRQVKRIEDKEANIFNDLYKNKPIYTPPKPVIKGPPTQSTSTQKPYNTPTPTTKQSSSSSNDDGCAIPIVVGIIFGIIGAAISNNGVGLVVGAIIGLFIGSQFTKK